MTAKKVKADIYNSDDLILESANRTAIDMMLEVYKSVLYGNDIFYCSAPITSGKRYINWLEHIGKCFVDIDSVDKDYHESHLREVIEPNRVHAQQIIQRLREQTGCIVIDPTGLSSLPGWTQQDWYYFWEQVIKRYVTTAFFVNDWQYSKGCVYEFWIAYKKGIPVFDEDQSPLSLETGINMITKATAVIQQGQSTAFTEMILDQLKQL